MTYSLKDALYHGSYIAAADLAAHIAHDKLFSGKKTVPTAPTEPGIPTPENKYIAKIAALQVMQEPDRPSMLPYLAGGAVAGTGALFGADAINRHLDARAQESALEKAKAEWQQQHAENVGKHPAAPGTSVGRNPYTGGPASPTVGRDAAGMPVTTPASPATKPAVNTPARTPAAPPAQAPSGNFTPGRSPYTGAPTTPPEGNRFLSVLTKKPLRTAGFLGGGALAGMALYPNS